MRVVWLLLAGLLCAASCTCSSIRAPVFTWGSSEFIQPGPSSRRVSYQTESTDLLDSLLRGVLVGGDVAAGAGRWFRSASAQPDIVVVFLGSKVDATSIGQLTHLEEALEAAPASVSMPYMHHEGTDSLQARLSEAVSAAPTVHRVGSCDGGAQAPLRGHPLPDLSGASDGPVVVLACASPEDSLADEAAALGALRTAVASKRHLFVYASEPEGGSSGPHRTLLARSAKKNAVKAPAPAPGPGHRVCDAKCKTQVKQLEAAMLLFTLLVALGFGVWCMGILDTPTRFETVKDDTR